MVMAVAACRSGPPRRNWSALTCTGAYGPLFDRVGCSRGRGPGLAGLAGRAPRTSAPASWQATGLLGRRGRASTGSRTASGPGLSPRCPSASRPRPAVSRRAPSCFVHVTFGGHHPSDCCRFCAVWGVHRPRQLVLAGRPGDHQLGLRHSHVDAGLHPGRKGGLRRADDLRVGARDPVSACPSRPRSADRAGTPACPGPACRASRRDRPATSAAPTGPRPPRC